MVVTCPGCNANYRVKDEAVPDDGAKMQCPKCNTVFLAVAPQTTGEFRTKQEADPAIDAESGVYDSDGRRVDTGPPKSLAAPGSQKRSRPPEPSAPPSASSDNRPAMSRGPQTPLEQLAGVLHDTTAPRSKGIQPPPNFDLEEQDPFSHLLVTTDDDGQRPQVADAAAVTPDARHISKPQMPAVTDESLPPTQDPHEFDSNTDSSPVARIKLKKQGEVSEPIRKSPRPKPDDEAAANAMSDAMASEGQAGPKLSPQTANALGWATLGVGVVVGTVGIVFAGWTMGVSSLNDSLMPVAEERFGVRPPRSTLGLDVQSVADLKLKVEEARARNDLVSEMITLKRLASRDPSDTKVKARVDALSLELGIAPSGT